MLETFEDGFLQGRMSMLWLLKNETEKQPKTAAPEWLKDWSSKQIDDNFQKIVDSRAARRLPIEEIYKREELYEREV